MENNGIKLNKDTITIRGDRNLWLEFSHAVKKNRSEIWDILKPLLVKYISNSEKESK